MKRTGRLAALTNRGVALVLPVIFLLQGGWQLAVFAAHPDWIGIDATIYYRGSAAWIAGADPWSAGFATLHYVGTPATVLLLAPFTVLPERVFAFLAVGISLAAAFYLLRRVRLPVWWIAFPPLGQGILNGNPVVVMMALLVAAHPIADALAATLRLHALAPIGAEARWRGLLATAGLTAISVVLVPGLWASFLGSLPLIGSRYGAESGGGGMSAIGTPALWIAAAVAIGVLVIIDRRAAGWLVIPALFPATGYYTAIMALPLIRPWMALLLLPFSPGWPALAVIVYAIVRAAERLYDRSPAPLAPPIPRLV